MSPNLLEAISKMFKKPKIDISSAKITPRIGYEF